MSLLGASSSSPRARRLADAIVRHYLGGFPADSFSSDVKPTDAEEGEVLTAIRTGAAAGVEAVPVGRRYALVAYAKQALEWSAF